ncbi:MAG: hypothetical protein AAF968_08385 [Pseudomonadota bacterium]
MTRLLTAIAVLAPSLALAHGGPAGHSHPHGSEALLLFGAAALGFLIIRRVLK